MAKYIYLIHFKSNRYIFLTLTAVFLETGLFVELVRLWKVLLLRYVLVKSLFETF